MQPQPISEFSPIITIPICGYLKFFLLTGKKPNPCLPITQLSKTVTLLSINVFLIITFDPIEQLSPIETFCSIIVLCPIKQLDPRVTLSPIKTFFPHFTLSLNFVSVISLAV